MENQSEWLKINEIGYAQQGAELLAKKAFSKKIIINERYDLHGLIAAEAEHEITDILKNSWHKHHRLILIIHGIGNNILKNIVWDYCLDHPNLLAITKAPPDLGGNGATLVLLKRRTTHV